MKYGKSEGVMKYPPLVMKSPTMKIKFKSKEEICQELKAAKGSDFNPEDFIGNSGKILIQSLNIKAIRLYITLRLRKVGESGKSAGILQSIINFFSSFTNISDAQIYFSEMDIENAY